MPLNKQKKTTLVIKEILGVIKKKKRIESES